MVKLWWYWWNKRPETERKIKKELADIFNYLVKLIDLLDVDIETEALQKIKENAEKYPVEKVKGKSAKYTDLWKFIYSLVEVRSPENTIDAQ